MADWRIGLSTGCFYQRPILDCLGPLREAGFTIIEVCSFPAHLDYHDLGACRRAGARFAELELEAYSFHAPFADWIDITTPDGGAREHARSELFAAAEAAAVVGAQHLIVHPGPERAGLPRHERLDRMENAVAVLNRVAVRCRELGVHLVLENMLPHLFSGAVRDVLWLLGALDSSDVDICLDTGHAFLARDLIGIAHKLSGHIRVVHASDNHGERDDHLPPGEGAVPWAELLAQLDTDFFRGSLILEIAGRASLDETLAGARRARAFLRDLAAAIGRPGMARAAGS